MLNVIVEESFSDSKLVQLRYAIRHGLEPDSPQLLSLWMHEEISSTGPLPESQWRNYLAQFHLLLDTFADSLVPEYWRCHCLNNINRPLVHLMRLAVTDAKREQVRELFNELRIISHHFH